VTPNYDGQNQSKIVYDDSANLSPDYDGALMLTTDEKQDRAVATRLIFVSFANLVAAEGGSQTFQIMDGVRRATAANLTGATTIAAEILNANIVSQGVRQVRIILCYHRKNPLI